MADYHISDIYQGGYSSLEPNYGSVFTGYHMPLVDSVQPTITGDKISQGTRLGVSTDPRTANVLKEVSEKLSAGQRIVELSAIDIGEATASIPKQHWDELRRLSKLTGVEVTVHGPISDASGFGERDFSEQQRELVQRKLFQSLERSHQINPEGNIPVTFHTSNRLPGPTWIKNKEGKEETFIMPIVNRDTGQVNQVKQTEHYSPGKTEKGQIKKEIWDVEKQLDIMNENEWSNSLAQVEFNRERAGQVMKDTHPIFISKYIQYILNQRDPKNYPMDLKNLLPEEYEEIKKMHSASAYLAEAQKSASGLFDRAYKSAEDERDELAKKHLNEIAKRYAEQIGIKDGRTDPETHFNPITQSEAVFTLIRGLEQIQPKLYVKSEDYALEKTSESFGNVAWESYKKFGKSSPIIQIENPPAGGGLSRGEDLKNVVEGAQKRFVEIAKGNGMSEEKATEEAKKLIGVTWDVGHINQLRKYGFTGKDIIEEAGKVAHLVKHIHLSDNFGLDNVELPMGMGNVDFKEVMAKLGKNGEEARKIVEAAHWWQFQQTSPVGVSMEALGSPIYAMKQSPYWNQVSGFQQGYFGGYGMFLPQINYETFGAGFSNLPNELGGQRGGGQPGRGRMSGTPME